MKVKGWIRTDRVGSTMEFTVNVSDEDLEDLNEAERREVIDSCVSEKMWDHAEWGWTEQ